MKSPRIVAIFVASLSFVVSIARADVTVLIHGWAANADTWLHSGVLPVLESHGWRQAGTVTATPNGISHFPAPAQAGGNAIYRVHLPAEAPLQIQAAHLYAELQYIRERHPVEPLSLVGHSAGGLVARLVVVRPEAPRVDTLVTIATPNLGTDRAITGLNVADSKPFFCPGPGIDFLKNVFGGDKYRYLKHSRGALVDMTPAAPGTLIGWLNQQPHPDITYHAIVRQITAYGDELVPAFSQDLNQVPPLRGRARVHVTHAGHGLNPADGQLLATILAPR